MYIHMYVCIYKTESNCAIIDCNLSKKHKLSLSKTKSAESCCFDFCQKILQKFFEKNLTISVTMKVNFELLIQ